MKLGPKFLHSLFEVAHVEFQTYDLHNHKVVFSSGVARQLLGYSEDDYHDLSSDFYKSIIHPDDLPKVRLTIDLLMRQENKEPVEMTIRFRRVDGTYIWLYSRQMVYERKRNGQTVSIIREVEDVTKLVELEGKLEEKVEQLKTVSYKNSHELRSPVASIIGLVNLIEEQSVTGDHNRQVLHFLKETVTRLDEVIHEINHVARVE